MRRVERDARKWAMQGLAKLGIEFPVNASYRDVSLAAMGHSKELVGVPCVFECEPQKAEILVAMLRRFEIMELRRATIKWL